MASCRGLERFEVLVGDSQNGLDLRELQQLNLTGTDCSGQCREPNCEAQQLSKADYVRTNIVRIVDEISQCIRAQLDRNIRIHEIVVLTHPEILGSFANQFRRAWPASDVFDGFGWDAASENLTPILTATLGILCIDQLPANIPWITGAHSQKVLGNLTPGSPANWRQLLRDMADFQPPVMRLRDAV